MPRCSIISHVLRLRIALACALPGVAACLSTTGSSSVPAGDPVVVGAKTEGREKVGDEPPKMDEAKSPVADEPLAELEPQLESSVEIPALSERFIARILDQQARVNKYALAHDVDPDLVNAVIWVESKFDRKARGPAGAVGLMQLMPRTAGSLAKRLKRRSRPYDPDFNIDAGCLYLHRILSRFDGDERLSLAAYNRGVGKVKSWLEAGEPVPERTAAYVDRVLRVKDWMPRLIAREGGKVPTTEEAKVDGPDAPIAMAQISDLGLGPGSGLDVGGARGILGP